MTVKQVQHLLGFLGYYHGETNGVADSEYLDATILFQDDYGSLAVDGIVGPKTEDALRQAVAFGMPKHEAVDNPESGDFWESIQHFRRDEFRCKCGKFCNGFPVEPDKTMVRYADAIRERLGVPLIVNSGVRCKTHNANVGGVANSQHVLGTACDLGCPSGTTPAEMAEIAEEVIGNTGGIGIYDWGIHIDSRKTKARWRG